MKIVRNAIECAYCGHEVVSTHRHHFASHSCEKSPLRPAKEWNAAMTELVDTGRLEHPYIAADGGNDYLRRVGSPEDYIEASEFLEEDA
jgi:hypothetical protein